MARSLEVLHRSMMKIHSLKEKLKLIKVLTTSESYAKSYSYFLGRLPSSLSRTMEGVHISIFYLMMLFISAVKFKRVSVRILQTYIETRVLTNKMESTIHNSSTSKIVQKLINEELKVKRLLLAKNDIQMECELEFKNSSNSIEVSKSIDSLYSYAWNASNPIYIKAVEHVVRLLTNSSGGNAQTNPRFLRDFTSNFGHLGQLFLYLNFYRNCDPGRIILLPTRPAANEFILELILRHSPLQIKRIDESITSSLTAHQLDTLHFSKIKEGSYRFESGGPSGIEQSFPEYTIEPDFLLSLSEEENYRGYEILSKELGKEFDWFALLHIRGPKNGFDRFSQARDSSILKYHLLCREVSKAGGIVIRNGSPDFMHLPRNFKAFDYAHSQIKTPFMDVWLNANCAFYIGNSNGASSVPISFGKPRLITNLWFINSNGPSYDHFAPKSLFMKGQRLNDEEAAATPISRVMNRKWISYYGGELKDLTPIQLAQVCSEFLKFAAVENFLTKPLVGVNKDLLIRYKDRPNKMTRIEYS